MKVKKIDINQLKSIAAASKHNKIEIMQIENA